MSISKFLATCASVSTMTRDEFTEKFCDEFQNDSLDGISASKLVESMDNMNIDSGIKSIVNGILNMNEQSGADSATSAQQFGLINDKMDALLASMDRLNSNLENLLDQIKK